MASWSWSWRCDFLPAGARGVRVVRAATVPLPTAHPSGAADPGRTANCSRDPARAIARSPAFFQWGYDTVHTGRRGKSHRNRIHGAAFHKTSPTNLTPRTGSNVLYSSVRPSVHGTDTYISPRPPAGPSTSIHGSILCWCIQSCASWLTCKLDPAACSRRGVKNPPAQLEIFPRYSTLTTTPLPVLSDCLYFSWAFYYAPACITPAIL